MGESTLETWCAQVGIIANRVGRDRTGWDGFLEFGAGNPPRARGGALDTVPEPIKCIVQVTSSDARGKGVALKLSNLQRMGVSSLPAFILVRNSMASLFHGVPFSFT